ncbi:glycoside hydrolase family 15 protein [Streptomyces sp. H036]|uniref:glycoside hydrolase family 15 protein n=1 Tax=Streptomyces sp. H036 TaxID=1519487 RepID=UPI0006AF2601|nr:glycoside hydrolase family 15 protein [Streptomyces sp. H036]KOV48702.1 glucoamylase [Streptomyces sp. H036]
MTTPPPLTHIPALRGPLIEDYGLIGDLETAALVCRNGSIDWLCLPRFDSAAAFAGLLGTDDHGFWRIGPAVADSVPAPYADRRRYRGDSLIVESEWDTETGTVRVLDFMPPRNGYGPQLIRIVEGVTGTVEMTSTLAPRFSYGQLTPWIYDEDGRTAAVSGPDAVWLDTSVPGREKDGAVHHRFDVSEGGCVVFALSAESSHLPAPEVPDADAALQRTSDFWTAWAGQMTYQGPDRDVVLRSLITLKALVHPSGGVVAAPTTSLPEEIGGVRNWDYRACWLRDSALTVATLLRAGYRDEAVAWQRWLLRTLGGDPDNLQIMYRVDGGRDLPELELAHLPGYEGSRPVRIGNQAADQLQLDVPGEVIETLYLAHQNGIEHCASTKALILGLVDYVRRNWDKPDDGIWEVRGGRRHFTHSKVMCWVAADRTLRMVDAGVIETDRDALAALRAEIHQDVCTRGFDKDRNTFTQSYGSTELDASLLLLPRSGFLPADDPRVAGTVDAVRQMLEHEGLVHRYPTDGRHRGVDGLPGDEGAFLLCSFWLVDALALTGRLAEATALLGRLRDLCTDLGLLAEEYDPVAMRQLGNFPQAFSMCGLADSSMLLAELSCPAELVTVP